jgi:hypothetical protein
MAAVTTQHFPGTSRKENVILQQAGQLTKTGPDIIETVKSELGSLCALLKMDELLSNKRKVQHCKD